MHTLSFHAGFVDKIKRGEKCQTVRAERKRPIVAGDKLRLFTGMRTKNCQFIKDVICTSVQPVYFSLFMVNTLFIDGRFIDRAGTEEFARKDGFESPQQMFDYFSKSKKKGETGFSGIVIRWCDPCDENNSGIDL